MDWWTSDDVVQLIRCRYRLVVGGLLFPVCRIGTVSIEPFNQVRALLLC